jgi:hypothetical protein
MPMSLPAACTAACAGRLRRAEFISFPACFTHLGVLARKLLSHEAWCARSVEQRDSGRHCRRAECACVTRAIRAIARATKEQPRRKALLTGVWLAR